MNTYSIGIDIGYSAIKIAIIDSQNNVVFTEYQTHKGQVKDTLELLFLRIDEKISISEIKHGAMTGSLGRNRMQGRLIHRVNEVAAAIEGSVFLNPEVKSIIEIGGQSARYYTGLSGQQGNTLRISKRNRLQMASNSDCAAGTGSFLEEQASRLNIDINHYSEFVQRAKTVPRIAGRCSVFAKTDIIHHQQEGLPSEDILKGVAYAIVKNYKGAVIRRLPIESPILFIGGVAKNQAIVDALRDVLHKTESELIVPKHFDIANSIGAALIAKKENFRLNFRKVFWDCLTFEEAAKKPNSEDLVPLSRLAQEDITTKHVISPPKINSSEQAFFLGVDIGSTSTNLVLINPDGDVVTFEYIRTKGNPLKAVQEGLDKIRSTLTGEFKISGVGITGSGRNFIGQQIGADVIKDEITAQAKAAVKIDPEVDTIFEIGGQDSKYISITNGTVTDFQMNKVCAAGTGSFLDEQAQEFNIPIDELGTLAFKGEHPVDLGERCTVFIKTSIASSLSKGEKTEDIVAGLCYSIAKNYLYRVVGQKKIGNKIMLQGGIAFNQGVANAFRILTQKPINTTPFFSVTGAYGAALIARDEMRGRETSFIGIEKLGLLSEEDEIQKPAIEETNSGNFNKKIEETIFDDYDNTIDPAKKTVGIPRALFTYGMFPMFNAIFKNLGFNVLLSDWSNEETIRLGQEFAMEETCFPVKLITGHVAELVSKGVDYLFFPDLYTIDHPGSQSRQNYGCAYMQLAFKIVSHTMELEKKGIKLLAPTIAFSLGKDFMRKSFSNLGELLGKSKAETNAALQKGMEAFLRFEERIAANGKKAMEKLDPGKITFVLVSKTYGVSDPVLNLGIPDKLMDMGYQVVPFFDLPEGADVSKEHPNMYWPFGQHILEPAYMVREHPNMFPILLSHHGCGPDSVLIHYFKEIMGDKPFLNIEIDEHASTIGVTTRIEAFVNSLKVSQTKESKSTAHYLGKVNYKSLNIKHHLADLSPAAKIYLPNIYPYSELFKELLIQKGHDVDILKTNAQTIGIGRKHTLTNEYYSLSSLLGDCFSVVENTPDKQGITFLIPQTEGAEVEGQFNRMLRTKLDEQNYHEIEIASPFLEDAVSLEYDELKAIFYCILAGDIVNVATPDSKETSLQKFKKLIRDKQLSISSLKTAAEEVYEVLKKQTYSKRVLAIGEPQIIFNDFLNNYTFNALEEQKHKVVYSPLSEAVWMFWSDFIKQNRPGGAVSVSKLRALKNDMQNIARELNDESPFTPEVETLVTKADETIGLYAGAFARYRQAKVLCNSVKIDGIITATSMYENTGISLNILHKGFSNGDSKPILNLTFDGNSNENDKTKVESFIYYL